MKVVILAGGMGSRLAEETDLKPKPMVEIGGRPILWHIMKHYASHGISEFIIALGYKGEYIKRFMLDCAGIDSNLSVQVRTGEVKRYGAEPPDWTVHLVDTGKDTGTGGRLKRLAAWLGDGTFMMTYGDGVGDIDIGQLQRFHRQHGCLATITAVRPPARFGELEFDGDHVVRFTEKPQVTQSWINGGFMVLEPAVLQYIDDDHTAFETVSLPRLAARRQLSAYRHQGFWQPMDTLREKRILESLWAEGRAPWKTW